MKKATFRVGDHVADTEIVGEAVFLHLVHEESIGHVQAIRGLEGVGQMPFALVGGVIALLTKEVSDRRKLGRQVRGPGKVRVVEHSVLLDVLTGIENGPRWSAYA